MLNENSFGGELLAGQAAVDARRQRGLEIAACRNIRKANGGTWAVPSSTPTKSVKCYVVRVAGESSSCTCPDHELRGCKCKHIFAVEYVIKREDNADGSSTVTET